MRLVSQNGIYDVPYDKVILGICDQNNKQEYVIYSYQENPRPLFLATYSTKDKALKVMEMLRKQYMRNNALYIDRENNARVMPQNSLFKFPDDSEVEV